MLYKEPRHSREFRQELDQDLEVYLAYSSGGWEDQYHVWGDGEGRIALL